ncbi:MAG: hypothetical protein EOP47_29795, partial [Sphingobacteriaceae bacterium]
MKQKYTYYLLLLIIMTFAGVGFTNAQSVSGTASTTGCITGGTITASSTGLGATPQFQLLKDGVVVAPDASNVAVYTNNTVFSSLVSGNYTLKGRADAVGTVYISANIIVANGYTPMTVITPTKTVPCTPSSAILTTNVTGGKSGYVYSIAMQSNPTVALQTSSIINATSFSFNALPVGSYLVSVTDQCGTTVTSASSISQSGALLSEIKANAVYIGKVTPGVCTDRIIIRALSNFGYVSNSS